MAILRKRSTKDAASTAESQSGPGAESTIPHLPSPLLSALDRGLAVPTPVIAESVAKLRRAHPNESPAQIAERLERRFLRTVTSSGAAVGMTAAIPAAGTGTAMVAVGGETALVLSAAAVLALSLAEVYGIPINDLEKRRTLVLSIAVGDGAMLLVRGLLGKTGKGWASFMSKDMSASSLKLLNSALMKKFLVKASTKQGLVTIGKIAPFGIGAVIGASGNRVIGKRLIRNSREILGPPPARWW